MQMSNWLLKSFMIAPTEILYCQFSKVAVGGKNNVLEGVTDRIHVLHNAIACDAARPRPDDGDEHAVDNYHSSRTIRRMILDCRAFAATLWKTALEGKCKLYADGFRYFKMTHHRYVSSLICSSNLWTMQMRWIKFQLFVAIYALHCTAEFVFLKKEKTRNHALVLCWTCWPPLQLQGAGCLYGISGFQGGGSCEIRGSAAHQEAASVLACWMKECNTYIRCHPRWGVCWILSVDTSVLEIRSLRGLGL